MRVTQEVKRRVVQRIHDCLNRAEAHYGKELAPIYAVYKKCGQVAGYARDGSDTITLNPVLLMENVDAFIHRTVAHEVAHVLDYRINGRRRTRSGRRDIHGPAWQAIMVVLGAPVSRCHSYDTSSVKRKSKKYIWFNDAGERMALSAIRHNRMLKGTHDYFMASHTGGRVYAYDGETA